MNFLEQLIKQTSSEHPNYSEKEIQKILLEVFIDAIKKNEYTIPKEAYRDFLKIIIPDKEVIELFYLILVHFTDLNFITVGVVIAHLRSFYDGVD